MYIPHLILTKNLTGMSILNVKVWRIFLLWLGLLFSQNIRAQQLTQFSSYLLNSSGINAAYSGSKDHVEVLSNYRKQWIQLDGSPSTVFFNINGFIKNYKVGLGTSLFYDRIGDMSSTQWTVTPSYRLSFKQYTLQLGFNVGVLNTKHNFTDFKLVDQEDDTFEDQRLNHVLPVLGAGFYFFSNTFYAGISSPDFLETELFNKKTHIYGSIGKVFDTQRNFKLKPSLLAKYVQNAPLQLDLSTTVIYNDVFGFGASWRVNAAYVFFAHLYVSDKLILGMAYDRTINGLSQFENGGLELTVSYSLDFRSKTVYSPRYF